MSEHGDNRVAPLISKHKSSKWGSILGNSSSLGSSCGGGAAVDNFEDAEEIPDGPQNQELVTVKSDSLHVVRMTPDPPLDPSIPVFSKWRRSTEPIQEINEQDPSSFYYKSDEEGGKSKIVGGKKLEDIYTTNFNLASSEIQQFSANLMDFKVDMKLEIQKVNNKINKFEGHLLQILKSVSPNVEVKTPKSIEDSATNKTDSCSDETNDSAENGADDDSKSETKEPSNDADTSSSPTPSTSDINNVKTTKVLVKSRSYTPRTSPTESTVRAMLESEIDEEEEEEEEEGGGGGGEEPHHEHYD